MLAGSSTLAAASAYFNGQILGGVFDNPQSFITQSLMTDITEKAKSARLQITLATPALREWLGSKQIKSLRALEQEILIKKYEKTIGVQRFDVENDRTGSVISAMDRFIQQIPDDVEQLLVNMLIANTALGYDGAAMLADSHSYSNSTGDNLTTSALGFETYRAGVQAMALFCDESGRSLNIRPNILLVGPKQERIAKEIVGATRPVPFSASAQDASSSIVAVTTIPNAFQGECTVLVSNKITGNQWFLFDTTKSVKPVIRAVAEELSPVLLDNRERSYVFVNDEYLFSAQGYMGFGPGPWQLSYGSVTA